MAPRISCLYCIDASKPPVDVARRNLASFHNCKFYVASVDHLSLKDNSMDFGYSLGVLHHVPNTKAGLKAWVSKLKKGHLS